MSNPKRMPPLMPRGGSMLVLLTVAALAAVIGFTGVYVTDRPAAIAVTPPTAGAAPAPQPDAAASASSTVNPLSTGAMTAFVFRKTPEVLPTVGFIDGAGGALTLDRFKGKTVLLNLWATWCGPCRKEMPALNTLQKALGGDKFQVVALSVDRGGIDASRKFLAEVKADSLDLYADPTAKAASALKALGMPTTLLIDPDGREVGRLIGAAEWDSPEAKALIKAAIR